MMLDIGARLLEYCAMDVVFVSIHFENMNGICGRPYRGRKGRVRPHNPDECPCQAGVAILDTRDLNGSSFESAIKTRQLTAGFRWYCEVVPKKLVYGTSETMKLPEMGVRLTELLRFTSTDGILRPIVVVGLQLSPNSNYGDIGCINKLTDPEKRSPIIDYLDLDQERTVLNGLSVNPKLNGHDRYVPPSLMRCLDYLGIHYRNLHVAANDAHFTLQAALMIAVQQHQDQHLTTEEEHILSKLKTLAVTPFEKNDGHRKYAFNYGAIYAAQRKRTWENRKKRKAEKHGDRRKLPENDTWEDMTESLFPWDIETEETNNLEIESTQVSNPGNEDDGKVTPNPESTESEDSSGCVFSSDEEDEEDEASSY